MQPSTEIERQTTSHTHEVAYLALADAFELSELIEDQAERISHLHSLPPSANIAANRIATLARAIKDAAMAAAQQGSHREASE